jgi:hypothetical protein
MYRHVASSITSSTVTAPRTEEVSATSAIREEPGTSAAREGSGTSAARKRSAVITTGTGSDIQAITTSRPPDDWGGAEPLSSTTTTSLPLGTASVGGLGAD